MAVAQRGAKITVDLGDRELHRQLRRAAVDQDRTVRDIVIEAVSFWLAHQEEIEDELAAETADRIVAESSGDYVSMKDVKDSLRNR
jgi:hypothetical protein